MATPLIIGERAIGDTSLAMSIHGADTAIDATDDCSGSDGAGPEYVFSIVPTETGTVCISTDGSSYDSVLHLRAADCTDPSTQVLCDDGGEGTRSTLAVDLTANQTYFLFVDGFGMSSAGNFTLTSFYSPDGNCDVIPECSSDDECGGMQRCTDGRCRRFCTESSQCDFGSLCLVDGAESNGAEGACVAVDCREDVHCGSGSCLNFQCVDCVNDSQCAYDEICGEANECERTFACQLQDTGSAAPCTTNEECGAGEACTDGACERTFECTITTDPQTGETSDNCLAYEECRAVSEDNTTVGQCVFRLVVGAEKRVSSRRMRSRVHRAHVSLWNVPRMTIASSLSLHVFSSPAANVQWTQTVQTKEMSAWIIAVLTTLNVD